MPQHSLSPVGRRLRLLAAAAVVAAAPVLASCGVNFEAQTNQVYTPAEGSNDRDGMVDVIHALVVSADDGSGTVVATLVNNDQEQPDELTGVEGAGDDSDVQVTLGDADATIPPGGALKLGETGHVTVEGDAVKAGSFVRLLFTFQGGEAAELNVPVVAATGEYEGLDTSGASASPRPSPSESPNESPNESPSASPTESPTE